MLSAAVQPATSATPLSSGHNAAARVQQAIAPARELSAAPPEAFAIKSTPDSLAVGLHSDQHGWMEVRAQVDKDTGEVSATLVANSSQAAADLHQRLPSLQHFLSVEQVQLGSLTVHQSSTPSSMVAADSGTGAASAGDHGQDRTGRTTGGHAVEAALDFDDETVSSPLLTTGGGWLNVIA